MSKGSWSLRKVVLCGMFAVLVFIIQLVVVISIVGILGSGMGFPVTMFLFPLMAVLIQRIFNTPGALLLISLIAGLLFLPIPAVGPAGFLPKVIIVFGCAAAVEAILVVSPKRSRTGATIAGAVGAVVCMLLLVYFFSVFNIPGVQKFLDLATIFVAISAAEGAIGGFLGELVYEKIEKRPAVQRLQK